MVDSSLIDTVKRYLAILQSAGIRASRAVLFGSYASGRANEWSDIDVVVIAPEFDDQYEYALIEKLWGLRRGADIRIEPVPCGEAEWERESERPIIEIAHREGLIIFA